MLKFNRRNKRLVIPVGINPNYGIDSSTLYNTDDADIVASDVIEGKVGYGKDGKIIGTLDLESEKEESYQAGITEQKAKLESIIITENGSYNREDGWNSVIVDVPDLNGDYNEGVEAGIEIGKAEIIEGMNDATITARTVFKGEIGYGKDGERIVGDYEFVEGFDFGVIGYNDNESNTANRSISDDIAYSKQLMDAWNPSRTNAQGYFQNNNNLVYAPNIDCSNIVNGCQSMFNGCSRLISVPLLNTSKCQYFGNMFNNCKALKTVGLDTASAKAFDSTFYNCTNLTSVVLSDTSKVTNMSNMFYLCESLTSVSLDTSNVTNYHWIFTGCKNLKTLHELNCSHIPGSASGDAKLTGSNGLQLINFGGLKDLGKAYSSYSNYNGDADFEWMASLSYESCMNIINKVYDLTLKPEVTYTPSIIFHATPYSLLSSDDIAIATAKGWTVQSA